MTSDARETMLEDHPAERPRVLRPGANCWRVERSTRTRCIQDADDYFRLAREVMLGARESIFLLGWDVLANLDLAPGAPPDGFPSRLAALLDFLVRRRKGLHCYVLVWDHSALHALERDPFTRLKLGWLTHRRVHFRFDDQHPVAASHHAKVLVVDDAVAFSGGIDLTTHRWDTVHHRVVEPLRVNAVGMPYGPYHDVQLMVEGPAAAALGELARTRWLRLGCRRLPPLANGTTDRWPDGLQSDFPPVAVGIARTEPELGRQPAVRECAALFADSIAAARRCLYIENQYFTDPGVARHLAARLAEPNGPEILVVVPRDSSGWLEHKTMGVLRAAVLSELARADRHGRLRLLHTLASREHGVPTFVHSKVMIVDDELLRVGSANLASRSMGMDSECDLAVAAEGDERASRAVARTRERLLAEHLGVDADTVRERCEALGSVARAIDSLSGGDRTLEPLVVEAPPPEALETVRSLVDPGEPMAFVSSMGGVLPELEATTDVGRRLAPVVSGAAICAAMVALWRAAVPGSASFAAGVAELLGTRPSPGLAAAALLAFVAGGLLFVPLHLLTLLAAALLGPVAGTACAVAGGTIAAAAGYHLGRHMEPQRIARWIGPRVYRLLRRLPRPTALSVALWRLVPVTSTTTLHLLCGAARVPFDAYMRGTLLGILPSVLAATAVGGLLRWAVLHDSPWAAAGAASTGAVLVAAMLRVRRRFLQKHADSRLQARRDVSGVG